MDGLSEFLKPALSIQTLSTFLPRRAILNALNAQLGSFHGTLLDIGCGRMPYKSILLAPPSRVERYVGMDLKSELRNCVYSQFGRPDIEWDGRTIPLEPNSIDCAISTETFEQCPDIEIVLREAIRVLKPGGFLFFTVPFLWPIHDPPYDQYRLTPFALNRHFGNSGFEGLTMTALGGWDASMAQMLGLWVGRRPMRRSSRRILTALAIPAIKWLLKHDTLPSLSFEDGTIMVTGIFGIARKPV
jgi:SAM-dependent methyltransferase